MSKLRNTIIATILSLPGIVAIIFSILLQSFHSAYDSDVLEMIVEYSHMLPDFDENIKAYIVLAEIQEYRLLIFILGLIWIVAVISILEIMKGKDSDEQKSN